MKNKKILWGVIFTIALIVFAFCGYIVISNYLSKGTNTQDYIENTTTSKGSPATDTHNINWEKLKKQNQDIYSWIYIPNTNVDYPVVQSDENTSDSFYLNHNIKKKYEFAGSIYSEKNNLTDYSDSVTVLYGHNMNNGSMFKTLHKFEDPKFFKKNKYVYIYMPNRKLTYTIYSAYVYDDRHILNSFDFSKKKVRKKYFKYTMNPDSLSKQTRKVDLNSDSKILTLSTCTNGAENTRFLVQAVLTKEEAH